MPGSLALETLAKLMSQSPSNRPGRELFFPSQDTGTMLLVDPLYYVHSHSDAHAIVSLHEAMPSPECLAYGIAKCSLCGAKTLAFKSHLCYPTF